MENKKYLNEEQYQKTKKKLNRIGTISLIVGAIILLFGFIMFLGFHKPDFIIFIGIGMVFIILGGQTKITSNRREINAFLTQQQMPITKERIEKMAPSASVAAKEIAKGIKEGYRDEEK